MLKSQASGDRRSNKSASRKESRASKDQKASQGTRPSQVPTQNRYTEPEGTTISRSRSKNISHDADQVNTGETTSETLHSGSVTPKTQNLLAGSGNGASSEGKGRGATPLEPISANSLVDQPRSDHATEQNRWVPHLPSGQKDHTSRTPIYVNHEPPSYDSGTGKRHAANGVRGLQPDPEATGSMVQNASQGLREDPNRAEGSRHRPEDFGNLPERLASFVADVANDDGRSCARFLTEETDAVNQPFVASTLRQAAIIGISSRNKLLADSCIKALGVIAFCRNSSREEATKLFTTMILRDNEQVTRKFERIVEEEKRICLVLSATYLSTDQHTNLTHLSDPFPGKRNDQPHRKISEIESMHNLLLGSPLIEKQQVIGEMFKKQEARFFQLGSMFKTVEHQCILNSSTESKIPERSRYQVVPSILYYISVKVGKNYCLALRARTYGGFGLSKPSHVSTSMESHAVIYDTEPQLLPGEPDKLKEKAIKVCLAPGVRDLGPSMRLDLGRVYTIEHTVRAQGVGEVADSNHLVAEWKKEMERES